MAGHGRVQHRQPPDSLRTNAQMLRNPTDATPADFCPDPPRRPRRVSARSMRSKRRSDPKPALRQSTWNSEVAASRNHVIIAVECETAVGGRRNRACQRIGDRHAELAGCRPVGAPAGHRAIAARNDCQSRPRRRRGGDSCGIGGAVGGRAGSAAGQWLCRALQWHRRHLDRAIALGRAERAADARRRNRDSMPVRTFPGRRRLP